MIRIDLHIFPKDSRKLEITLLFPLTSPRRQTSRKFLLYFKIPFLTLSPFLSNNLAFPPKVRQLDNHNSHNPPSLWIVLKIHKVIRKILILDISNPNKLNGKSVLRNMTLTSQSQKILLEPLLPLGHLGTPEIILKRKNVHVNTINLLFK